MSKLTQALTLVALAAPASASAQSWTNSHPAAPGWSIRYSAAVAEESGQNQIFQFGGTEGLSSSASVWRYHRTNGWFVMNNMPGGRHDTAATKVEIAGMDYVHLIGGGVGGTAVTTTNWRYDPSADSWDTTSYAPMPVAKANMEAVTAPNGLIYVFGGNNASGSATYSSMHIYDPIANVWSSGPTMPRARRNFAAIKDCDGYIYLYGGSANSLPIAEVDCFDTVSNAWVANNPHTGGALPNMLTPRDNVAGALGRNGRHYVTGGNIASPVAVPMVEAFNPYTNVWTSEPSMLESRNAHRVVGLGSRVWVLGGYRKIWPTTNKLESFGALGLLGPCTDDVGLLPPPIYGQNFATAVALDFASTFTGGVIRPGESHYFSCEVSQGVKTFIDIDTGEQQHPLTASVFNNVQELVFEGPADRGVLLDLPGVTDAIYTIVLSNGHGIGSSGYDLYVSSTNDARPIGEVYCTAAVPNSTGDPSGIRAVGLASAEANSVQLQVVSLPPQNFGFFLVAPEAGRIVSPGGSAGILCLTGFQIGRYDGNILNSGANGEVQLNIDTGNIAGNPSFAVQPGQRLYFTYWHRDVDPVSGATSNFSDGVCIDFR